MPPHWSGRTVRSADVPVRPHEGLITSRHLLLVGSGAHTVSAVYNGSATVGPSGPVTTTLTVVPALTATSLALSATTVRHGGHESVTVTVSRDPSSFWPTGTVTVHVAVGAAATTKTVTLGAAKHGVVTLTITMPSSAGAADVYAVYSGSTKYVTSTSAHQTIHVT